MRLPVFQVFSVSLCVPQRNGKFWPETSTHLEAGEAHQRFGMVANVKWRRPILAAILLLLLLQLATTTVRGVNGLSSIGERGECEEIAPEEHYAKHSRSMSWVQPTQETKGGGCICAGLLMFLLSEVLLGCTRRSPYCTG